MKKIPTYVIAILAVVLLLSAKFVFFPGEKAKAAAPGKNGKKPSTTVTVFVVGNERLENKIVTSGSLLPKREAELWTETSGRIVYVNFSEGK